jgi:hypothetical protein
MLKLYFSVFENRRSDRSVRAKGWLVQEVDAKLLDYLITIKEDERSVGGRLG